MTESQNIIQNNSNNMNQFHHSMFNEPLPPTPSFRPPIPSASTSSPSNNNTNMFIPSSPSTSNHNQQHYNHHHQVATNPPNSSYGLEQNQTFDNREQFNGTNDTNGLNNNNNLTIVGPSDHYGMHHNFNTSDNNNRLNSNMYQKSYQQSTLAQQKETKVCVIVDSRTPVILTIPQPPSKLTLQDLKLALPSIDQPNYKYFFKSNDSEFGIVKEEIQDDDSVLPTYKNRVVAWIVTPGRIGDELASSKMTNRSVTDTCNLTYSNTSYDDNGSSSLLTTDIDTTSYFTETDDDSISCSNYSESTCDTFLSQRRNNGSNARQHYHNHHQTSSNALKNNSKSSPIHHNYHPSQSSPYRYCANNNSIHNSRNNNLENISTSSSSTTTSTTSNSSSASHSDATAVHCVNVHLVLTNENFLGLHIDPKAINGVDAGIYVDGVTENSVVALDGRIEPNDKLIQVNDINVEELSNEEAVRVLKEAVIRRGPLKLVVAKFVESNNKNNPVDSIVNGRDAIHPIDTAAWVEAHANAITMPMENQDQANSATSSPSFGSHAQDTDCIRPSSANMTRLNSGLRLNKATNDIKDIIHHMKLPDIGLDIKDREWLKIHIPKAFLGSNLVSWLERNVYGFDNNGEAKKFASRMLKDGYIRDPLSKKSFSSKSYYIFVI